MQIDACMNLSENNNTIPSKNKIKKQKRERKNIPD
jgi:hypothetical protein